MVVTENTSVRWLTCKSGWIEFYKEVKILLHFTWIRYWVKKNMRDELLWYQPRACVIGFCTHASIQEASTTKNFIYSPFTKTFFFYLNDKQSFGLAMLKFEKKPSYLMKIISYSLIYLNIRYLKTSEPSPFY